MNSVAMNYVATTMSQNQNAKATTRTESNGFGKVFQKSYQTVSKQSEQINLSQKKIDNGQGAFKQKQIAKKMEKPTEKPTEQVRNGENVTEDVKSKLIQEVTDKMKEITSKDELSSEELENIEAMMLEEVSKVIGVSVNEMKSLLQEMDINVMDLFSNNHLKATLNQLFDLSSDGELMQNENVFSTFKDLKELFNDADNKALSDLYQEAKDYLLSKENENFSDDLAETSKLMQMTVSSELVSETVSKAGQQNVQGTKIVENLKNPLESKVEVVDMRDENFIKEKDGEQTSNQNGQSFTELFSNAVNEKTTDITIKANGDVVYREINANEILNQVVTKMKVELGNTNSTMSVQLTPENLGKVALSITSTNGIVAGNIVAENSAVKEILEMNIANLKATLEEQGVKIDDIKVVVGNTNQFFEKQEQEQQSNFQKGKKGKKISKILSLEEVEEVVQEKVSVNIEHSVEYSA